MSGHLNSNGSPLPADEWTLCLFATYLADTIKYSSVKVYLSAIRSMHIDAGFSDPLLNGFQLQRVVRGIKRSQGTSLSSKRLPVTVDILKLMHSHLSPILYDDVMFWSACTLAFFGFLRSAEFTVPGMSSFDPAIHLTVNDIAVDSHSNPTCLQVLIKASKTDPFRQGCTIVIGRGSSPICAIEALISYLRCRGDRPGPLFLHENGQPLSRVVLANRLQLILQAAGIPGHYSTHSFRIGAATSAAKAGIPDHLIQVLGRWKSDAYKVYIQTPRSTFVNASKSLVA